MTSTVTIAPWKNTSNPIPPANIPSLGSLGFLFMISASLFSIPRARAGKQSVMRFIHKRCTGSRMVNPISVAKNMDSTSARFEASRNCIALRILA